jgi:hypothetical protein
VASPLRSARCCCSRFWLVVVTIADFFPTAGRCAGLRSSLAGGRAMIRAASCGVLGCTAPSRSRGHLSRRLSENRAAAAFRGDDRWARKRHRLLPARRGLVAVARGDDVAHPAASGSIPTCRNSGSAAPCGARGAAAPGASSGSLSRRIASCGR